MLYSGKRVSVVSPPKSMCTHQSCAPIFYYSVGSYREVTSKVSMSTLLSWTISHVLAVCFCKNEFLNLSKKTWPTTECPPMSLATPVRPLHLNNYIEVHGICSWWLLDIRGTWSAAGGTPIHESHGWGCVYQYTNCRSQCNICHWKHSGRHFQRRSTEMHWRMLRRLTAHMFCNCLCSSGRSKVYGIDFWSDGHEYCICIEFFASYILVRVYCPY